MVPKLQENVTPKLGQLGKGNLCHVGVLIADIVGYTGFCESSDLIVIRDFVREIHEKAILVIESWEGTVLNIMGDAIMAAFLPYANSKGPVWSAVSAGCLILKEIRKLKTKKSIQPCMHAGVEWGKVWVGRLVRKAVPGSVTVLGPAVNRAARYQKEAEKNEIVLRWTEEVQHMLEEGDPFLPGMYYRQFTKEVPGLGMVNLVRVGLPNNK